MSKQILAKYLKKEINLDRTHFLERHNKCQDMDFNPQGKEANK